MIAYFERTAGTLLIHEFWVALVTQGCSQSAGQPLIKNCPQTGIVVECRIQHFPQLVRDYVTIDTPGTQEVTRESLAPEPTLRIAGS